MARGRGRRSDEGSSADISHTASPDPLAGLLDPLPALPVDPLSALDDFMSPVIPFDQRAFSMEVTHGKNEPGRNLLAPELSIGVARTDGRRVAVCVRRNTRREVLHALNRVRKSGGGAKRHRTWQSSIKC